MNFGSSNEIVQDFPKARFFGNRLPGFVPGDAVVEAIKKGEIGSGLLRRRIHLGVTDGVLVIDMPHAILIILVWLAILVAV